MDVILRIAVGLLVVGFLAFGNYVVIWKWWLQPLTYAWRERQWRYVAIIALGGWFAGSWYLGHFVDDYPVTGTQGFAKGQVITLGPYMMRILRINGPGSMRCLNLGERQLTALP